MPESASRPGAQAEAPPNAVASRALVTKKQIRGRRGRLRDMPTMPMDVLLEIFSHLLPADLLNLARTSKPFRALLMTRSSATLWKISRRLVDGLPDCPVHLSEPAYANLIFSPYCHNCMKPNTQSITWEFLIRYCSSCKKSMMVKFLDRNPHARFVREESRTLLPLLNKTEIRGKVFYHVRQIEQVKQKWDESHANEDKWSQYVREQRQRVQAIQDLAQACTLWATKRANIRAQELDQIRQRRLEFIVSKLRDMGWGEELDMLPSDMLPLADHAHVRLSKDITERGWEKIRDEVASVMQHNKDLRMARERSAVLRERLQTLASVISATRDVFGRSPATESCPKFPDYALMPQFRALVEAPNEERIDEEAFKDLRTALPTLDARWKAEQVSLLQNMLAKALGRIPEGGSAEVEGQGDPLDHPYADLFHLAMAVFECQRCSYRMPGISTLSHRCARDPGLYWFMDDPFDEDGQPVDMFSREVRRIARGVARWDISCFSVPDLEPLKKVIRTCGKDPETVGAEEMNALNVRLAVKDKLLEGQRKVMTWDALMHAGHLDRTVSESGWQLEVLSEDDKCHAVALEPHEEEILSGILTSHEKFWRCALCDEMPTGGIYPILLEHVEERHDKSGENRANFLYMHPDVSFSKLKKSILLPAV